MTMTDEGAHTHDPDYARMMAAGPNKCDWCGAMVAEIIGTPSGDEICRRCFDNEQRPFRSNKANSEEPTPRKGLTMTDELEKLFTALPPDQAKWSDGQTYCSDESDHPGVSTSMGDTSLFRDGIPVGYRENWAGNSSVEYYEEARDGPAVCLADVIAFAACHGFFTPEAFAQRRVRAEAAGEAFRQKNAALMAAYGHRQAKDSTAT